MESIQKPPWIKVSYQETDTFQAIKSDIKEKGLATVCQAARCPNISECWNGGTATFLLMGDTCTRGCRFCYVKTSGKPLPLDKEEPEKLLESIKRMKLSYVVLTSVDRDDLQDQGATHLANCITFLKDNLPELKIEILIPDFRGNKDLIKKIVDAKPDVIAHNIETVERLTPKVRDIRANYKQSLAVLSTVKQFSNIYTKSSIMVGLGETENEVIKAMDDLKAQGVSFITIGQYLQPSKKHLPVASYIPLETFKYYEQVAYDRGFLYAASGPLVRSSYKAGELYISAVIDKKR
ncbi:MAG: lipoyl synthase [Nanoarchaeota archaeon]